MRIQDILPEEKLDSILVSLFGESFKTVLSRWTYYNKLGAVLNTWYSGYNISFIQLVRNPEVREITSLKDMDTEGFYVVKDMSIIFESEPSDIIYLCPVHHVKLKPRGLRCPVCGDAWKKKGLRKEVREVYHGIMMDREDNKLEAIYIGKELPGGWVLGATLDALVYLRVVWRKTDSGFEAEKHVEILEVIRTEPFVKDVMVLKPGKEASVTTMTGVMLEEEPVEEEVTEKKELVEKEEGEERKTSKKDLIKSIKAEVEGALIMGKKICIDSLAEKHGVSEDEVEKILEILGYEVDEEGCIA